MSKLKIFSILILISFFLTNSIQAQRRLKYKDIYEIIIQGDKETSYTQLLAYQKQDPQFASTYFQLALIAKVWAKQYDPLTDFKMAQFFIYNTKLYFGLAKLKMIAESGKNREYYENAGIVPAKKKISPEEIAAFIDSNMVEIKEYERQITAISNYFSKTVEYYNNCVFLFKEVNRDYDKVKDIYLGSEKELIDKLTKIKIKFDSTIICFNNYSQAIKEYPILNYHQKYELKSIETFRLDGLTNANFLQNDIVLWNYSSCLLNQYAKN